MNGHGLLNTSSPKLTVPQVSEQASGAASRTASRLAKLSVTAPPVDSWTMRSVPSRSAATVSASLLPSSVGRAASSLMCTWMTAAPAASHSLAVTTSSPRVTGRAGAADLSASAPVGATVIRVVLPPAVVLLPAMGRTLPRAGLARRHGQVLPDERQRLGQVRHPVLPRRRPAGLHLDRVPRRSGGRGEDQPGAGEGGPDGGPGRVAGVRPAAPGRGGGPGQPGVMSFPWQAAVPRQAAVPP